jgi:hypothetical protein
MSINIINTMLNEIERYIPVFEKTNTAVSQSTVGWQVEHTLLVLNGVVEALSRSNPPDYRWRFNFVRTIVLLRKKIPRGRGKAPKRVQPQGDFDIDSLTSHLSKTRENLKRLLTFDKNASFEHPYFGKLNLKNTISFLEIHTQHHLDIIRDIVR